MALSRRAMDEIHNFVLNGGGDTGICLLKQKTTPREIKRITLGVVVMRHYRITFQKSSHWQEEYPPEDKRFQESEKARWV
jgi:hypothetical protein